jgi:hypothetical protein
VRVVIIDIVNNFFEGYVLSCQVELIIEVIQDVSSEQDGDSSGHTAVRDTEYCTIVFEDCDLLIYVFVFGATVFLRVVIVDLAEVGNASVFRVCRGVRWGCCCR